MEQFFQVAGALLILAAYIAGQAGRLNVTSWRYLVLNLVGSAVLAVVAALDADWGSSCSRAFGPSSRPGASPSS